MRALAEEAGQLNAIGEMASFTSKHKNFKNETIYVSKYSVSPEQRNTTEHNTMNRSINELSIEERCREPILMKVLPLQSNFCLLAVHASFLTRT